MDILSDKYFGILNAILVETTVNMGTVDADQFRAQNDDHLQEIDDLEAGRFLQRNEDKYSVNLAAIDAMRERSHAAAHIYNLCAQCYPIIRQYYRDDTKRIWKLPELIADARLSQEDGVLALRFLIQTNVWSTYTSNVADPNAHFRAGDSILRYKTFDDLMRQTREWQAQPRPAPPKLHVITDDHGEVSLTVSAEDREDSGKDNIANLLESLQEGLTAHATDGRWDDTEYRRIRRAIIEHPTLSKIVPEFIKRNRNLEEFWSFIKDKFKTYRERRLFISESLYPLFNKAEQNTTVDLSSYQRGELLGQGGFGEVYRYRNSLLNMDFAFKIFSPVFRDDRDNYLERFFREAKILFGLNHKNIIRVFDIGIMEGRPFIRMECFEGRNLNEVLKQHGHVSPTKALKLVKEIVEALEHAYASLKVVHRDLKPSNILVARNQFRIIDFGLGAFVEHEISSRLTRTGERVAGGYYTAPELLADPALLDPRCDMYSMGAIWYTLLLGRPPAGTEIAYALESLKQLTPKYRNAVSKMLAPLPRRYDSYASLLLELKDLEKDFPDVEKGSKAL